MIGTRGLEGRNESHQLDHKVKLNGTEMMRLVDVVHLGKHWQNQN